MKRRFLAAALACALLTGCGPVRTEPADTESAPADEPVIAYVPLDDRPDNAERVVYLADSLGYELLLPEADDYRTALDGQPLTQKQLADRCEQDAAAMSRTLDKMQQAGLVQRLPHPESRRCFLIALTPEGESTARQVQKLFDDLEKDLCRGFSPDRQEQLLAALDQMLHNLQPE